MDFCEWTTIVLVVSKETVKYLAINELEVDNGSEFVKLKQTHKLAMAVYLPLSTSSW